MTQRGSVPGFEQENDSLLQAFDAHQFVSPVIYKTPRNRTKIHLLIGTEIQPREDTYVIVPYTEPSR